MNSLTTRLEKLYASAVYDTLRSIGHDNCVLPPGIAALIPGQKLAGEIFTIDGHFEVGQDANKTLLEWSTVLSKAPSGKVLICQPNTHEVALMGELSSEVLKRKGVLGYIVDGASRVQNLRHIIAPLSTPGLVVVGIYAFIGAYAQQFLFAITFNQKKEYMPIPSGLYEFIGYTTVKWNEMMAASLVGIAPVLILFIFLQKYIVEGLTSGAVKN